MQEKNIFFILVIEFLEVILTSEGKEKQVATKAMLTQIIRSHSVTPSSIAQ